MSPAAAAVRGPCGGVLVTGCPLLWHPCSREVVRCAGGIEKREQAQPTRWQQLCSWEVRTGLEDVPAMRVHDKCPVETSTAKPDWAAGSAEG